MKELLLENMNLCDIIDIGCDNMALPKIIFKEMTLQENGVAFVNYIPIIKEENQWK